VASLAAAHIAGDTRLKDIVTVLFASFWVFQPGGKWIPSESWTEEVAEKGIRFHDGPRQPR
jgi:hypothetical protein